MMIHTNKSVSVFLRAAISFTLTLFLVAAIEGCSDSPKEASDTGAPVDTEPGVTYRVAGTVKLQGARPSRRLVQVDKECEEFHGDTPLLSDAVIVNEDGGLHFSFVYVENPPAGVYPIPEEPAVLDQRGCRYEPHVFAFRAGQKLRVVNSDPFTHNVRSWAKENRPFNMGQPPESSPRIKTYSNPEMAVKLKCDVHRWMQGYMFVMEHPFHAVTDEAGRFEIGGLPAGDYTLVAWHERFGELRQEVHVDDGIPEVAFTFVR